MKSNLIKKYLKNNGIDFYLLTNNDLHLNESPNLDLKDIYKLSKFDCTRGYILFFINRFIFFTDSDDGSQLFIGDDLVVDNDGLHSMKEVSGSVALSAGYHPIRVTYFEKNGGNKLNVYFESMNIQKQSIPDDLLSHR